MKTKEELNALKAEVKAVSNRITELTDEELAQVSGGADNDGYFTYTVKKGDSLSVIAIRYGTTVRTLCEINGIKNPDRISDFTTLRVPLKIH